MPAISFNTPFAEQRDFFRAKLNLPSARWDDIQKSAHDRGFIVAGAQSADLVQDFRNAVGKAIAEGKSLGWFQSQFDAIVQKHGWSGWTGEGSQAGRDWRSRVIYSTNMSTSYAAGRWQQLNDPGLLKFRPYWRYVHADGISHPRPLHVSWHGLVLPHDHPFWKTHFPPNGWYCHCRVTTASEADYQAAKGSGRATPPGGWQDVDPKTGAAVGIDKGFDYAPGRTWHPDLDKYPYDTARAMVEENLKDGVFERWHGKIATQGQAEISSPEYSGLGKAAMIDKLRRAIASQEVYPVAVLPPALVEKMGVGTQVVKLSSYDLVKQQISRAGQDFDALEYFKSQAALDNASLIVRENDQMILFVSDVSGSWYAAVLQQTASGKAVFLKSFRRSSLKDARLQRKKGEVLIDTLPN